MRLTIRQLNMTATMWSLIAGSPVTVVQSNNTLFGFCCSRNGARMLMDEHIANGYSDLVKGFNVARMTYYFSKNAYDGRVMTNQEWSDSLDSVTAKFTPSNIGAI